MTSLWECGWSCLCESKAICPRLALAISVGDCGPDVASQPRSEGSGFGLLAARVLPTCVPDSLHIRCTRKKTR